MKKRELRKKNILIAAAICIVLAVLSMVFIAKFRATTPSTVAETSKTVPTESIATSNNENNLAEYFLEFPKQDEIVYQSKNFNYLLTVPQELSVSLHGGLVENFDSWIDIRTKDQSLEMGLLSYDLPKNTTFDEYLRKKFVTTKNGKVVSYLVTPLKSITINGMKGFQYDADVEGGRTRFVDLQSGNTIHSIFMTVLDKYSADEEDPRFKTIVSRFEVIPSPLNEKPLKKEIVTKEVCSNPIGLIVYYDEANKTSMKISSSATQQKEAATKGLEEISNFLQDKLPMKTYQDVNSWEQAFHNYCGGSTNMFIKELPGITYPNTERARAFLSYTTQSVYGNTTVVVLAQKGNSTIQLTKYLEDQTLYAQLQDDCLQAPSDYSIKTNRKDFVPNEQCYNEKLLKDISLQNAAIKEAKAMVSEFAVK